MVGALCRLEDWRPIVIHDDKQHADVYLLAVAIALLAVAIAAILIS